MLLKSCRCGKLIPQSMKMCEECEHRQQSRHMIYNNTRRDERAAEFYVSKEWRAMRERIIEVYDNIDIYALYVEHELLTSGIWMIWWCSERTKRNFTGCSRRLRDSCEKSSTCR